MGSGGRQWQEFLAAPGHAYIEIQAGLARTQMECLPMPPRMQWAWTEAFGYLEADPAIVHGNDWHAAWSAVADCIEAIIPRAQLDALDRALATTSAAEPVRLLSMGSGWGALERRRKQVCGEPDETPLELVFPEESMGPEVEPWLALLREGRLPYRPPSEEPGALMTQSEWQTLLEANLADPAGDHWLAWWHLGNMRMEARDIDGACAAWERSLANVRTGWALRNLATAAKRRGDEAAWLRNMAEAWDVGPRCAALAIEYAQALSETGRFEEVLRLVRGLSEELRSNERVLLLWAKAALQTGDIAGVEAIFDHEFATIREGEVTLTDLWFAFHERRLAADLGRAVDDEVRRRVRRECPPPRSIDFRMAVTDDGAADD